MEAALAVAMVAVLVVQPFPQGVLLHVLTQVVLVSAALLYLPGVSPAPVPMPAGCAPSTVAEVVGIVMVVLRDE